MANPWPTQGASRAFLTQSGIVKSGPGIFFGISIDKGASTSSVTLYDAKGATALAEIGLYDATTTNAGPFVPPVGTTLTGGLYATYSGTAAVTVYYF